MSESNDAIRTGDTVVGGADAWLSRPEAANYLRISSVTLAKLAMIGGGPPFYRPSRRVVYRKSDLDNWMIGRRSARQSDAGDAAQRAAHA